MGDNKFSDFKTSIFNLSTKLMKKVNSKIKDEDFESGETAANIASTDEYGHDTSFSSGNSNEFLKLIKNFNWDQFINVIFGIDKRPVINNIFSLTLIFSLAYGSGKIISESLSFFLRPKEITSKKSMEGAYYSQNNYRQQIKTIKIVNAFKIKENDAIAEETDKKPKQEEILICLKANQKTSLPLKLISTTTLQNAVKSLATIQVQSQKDFLNLREGEKILGMAEIGKIEPDKVIFKNINANSCEYIGNSDEKFAAFRSQFKILDAKSGKKLISKVKHNAIKQNGNSFSIKKKFKDQMLKDINNILTQARAIQINNPDGSLAFKITEITPGSVYSMLNIEDNDIITQINGKPIQSLNEVMSLFGKIKKLDHLELTMKKDGVEQNFEYNFTK